MEPNRESDYFIAFRVPPSAMDSLWAEGWRHFGWYFFRYRTSTHGSREYSVIPLRVDLDRFVLSRSQRRILARNRDADVVIRDAVIDGEREVLFEKHALRFEHDVPSTLRNFVSPLPATVPCPAREVAVYVQGRLAAFTYLDVGRLATSAVYAVYDTDDAKRSLGIYMMLRSIEYSRSLGCQFYYHGYAYREPFVYDYKKRFSAVECLEWDRGWVALSADEGAKAPEAR